MDRGERKIKVWRVSKDSNAGVELTENAVVMAGNRANFISTHQAGVTIMAKSISFGTLSENQRHGALFIKMNDLLQMVPTTLVTPVPNQTPFPPFGLASAMLSQLPFFIAMLSTGAIAATLVRDN